MVAQWHTFNFQSGSDHCNRSIKTIITLYRNKINFITRQFEGSVTNYISCANDGTGLKYRWQPALSHETWRNEDLGVPLVCINLNDTCKTFPGYWWNKHKILQYKIIMMEGSGFYFSSSHLKTHSLVYVHLLLSILCNIVFSVHCRLSIYQHNLANAVKLLVLHGCVWAYGRFCNSCL